MYLEEIEDKNGKIPPRLVDMDSEISKLWLKNLHYLTAEDNSRAKAYLDDPEKYDFNKILNWN